VKKKADEGLINGNDGAIKALDKLRRKKNSLTLVVTL
jgi:hypothetical protein